MAEAPSRSWRPIPTAIAIIVFYGVARALVEVRVYLALAFAAVVFAAALTYPIDFIARKLPRAVATLITLLAVLGVVVGLLFLVVPIVVDQATQLVHTLPSSISQAMNRLPEGRISNAVKSAATTHLGAVFSKMVPLAIDVGKVTTAAILIFIAGFFLAATPASYLKGLLTLVPREHETTVADWWQRTGAVLRRWVAGVLAAMLIMGTLTGIGLGSLRVHDWFLLALLTFFGTSVPYLGAIVSSIPALLVAWTMSPVMCLWVLLLYIGIHHIEGYVVQPFIMRRAVELRPATLLGWLLLMSGLLGIAGTLIATPALACLKVTVGHLWVERRLKK